MGIFLAAVLIAVATLLMLGIVAFVQKDKGLGEADSGVSILPLQKKNVGPARYLAGRCRTLRQKTGATK